MSLLQSILFSVNKLLMKLRKLLTDVASVDQSYYHYNDDDENDSDDSSYQPVLPLLVFFCKKRILRIPSLLEKMTEIGM